MNEVTTMPNDKEFGYKLEELRLVFDLAQDVQGGVYGKAESGYSQMLKSLTYVIKSMKRLDWDINNIFDAVATPYKSFDGTKMHPSEIGFYNKKKLEEHEEELLQRTEEVRAAFLERGQRVVEKNLKILA